MKTFFIKTLGCKVNQCDTREMADHLRGLGMRESDANKGVDLYVINTCCVTQQAERKSRYAIREALRFNKYAKIAVVGCYAVYDRATCEKIKGVSAVFTHDARKDFYRWAHEMSGEISFEETLKNVTPHHRTRAFIKIQEGCDNRCSYCVVPLVRGPSRSKPRRMLLDEARGFIRQGYKEVVLTGICLGSFGKDLTPVMDLADILDELEQVNGLERIRLSSIEAQDISEKLIKKIASSGKICPHMHIPFQSGDDHVLRAMNKRLTTSDYKNLVTMARSEIKDLAITCDFIVGFPQEEEEHFKKTLEFLQFVNPLKTHVFTYSPRGGTISHAQGARFSDPIIKERFDIFKEAAREQEKTYVSHFLGRDLDVLFEANKTGIWQGYSANYITVKVKTNALLRNELRRVKVVECQESCAIGAIH